ncbi:adenosine deaminase [Vibrio sp. PP-XX7]
MPKSKKAKSPRKKEQDKRLKADAELQKTRRRIESILEKREFDKQFEL